MNNNDYFIDGVGPTTGYYGSADQVTLANWQVATSQDATQLQSTLCSLHRLT